MNKTRGPASCSRLAPKIACLSSVLLAASPGRAQEPLVDYDQPTSDRAFVDYARAGANLAFVNWTFWQIAWSRDKDWAPITRSTLKDNLRHGFEWDQDILQTNFFGHPYHGSLQFNSARGAGLSFWESAAYTLAGSMTWELFAEREKPSLNDLAVTTLGGVMLGEIMHRLSSQILDDSEDEGRLSRELMAAAVNPMRGFDRLTTGRAWRNGHRPVRRPVRIALEFGVDRVSMEQEKGELTSSRPAVLLAVDVEYGTLLPAPGERQLGAFDYFELYAATNLFNSQLSGAHVYSHGLLYGVSLPLSVEPRPLQDNDVFGFGMSYEYVGTNFATYSGIGIGPVNHLVLRLNSGRSLRLSVGGDLVPVLGASSTEARSGDRDYNFASGFSPWSGLELRLGKFGEIGLQMRHYIAKVVDGVQGDELIGSLRLWYEVEPLRGLGIGIAPTSVYRRGLYADRDSYWAQQLSAQLYLTVRP